MTSKEKLKQIILNQKARGFGIERTISRDLEKDIKNWMKDNRILILTGIRRSGKSTILKHLMKISNEFCYVNFEDEGFLDFEAKDFEILNEILIEIYGDSKFYFFDEIQVIDKFETFVRRLQDDGKKIFLTGSNASLLSREFATKLTGRNKTFEVYPFSFKEFLKFESIEISPNDFLKTIGRIKIKKYFKRYFENGGMPEYLKLKDIDYLKNVYDNIIYRDIVARYDIKKEIALRELVLLLTSNISNSFTYNSLRKSLKLSNAITVKDYIGYLKNSYLFFETHKFSYSLKEQLNSPKKIYLIDHAFHKVIGTSFFQNKGWILENVIFLELLRRGNEIYYFSEKGECDFVIKELNKIKQVIQVCYELNEKNKKREIGGLIEAMEKFKLKNGLILTYDQDDEFVFSGKKIKVIPVWKWLLKD